MKEYPLPKFSFLVDWGPARLGFTEITGLERTIEPIEYREGSNQNFTKLKMPGLETLSNVTLKRGTFQSDTEFYDWFNTVQMNTAERRDVTISLLNEEGDPTMVWSLTKCFVVKYQATDLKADGNEVAIETLEIAHEGLSMVKP
jgi:phage tail-like protein